MEQRGAMPFEACLGPAHASGAAPGQYDTGYRTHTVECTYLHKLPNPQGGQTPLRVCYLERHVVATQRPGMSARSSGKASEPFTAHSSVRRSLIAHAGGQRLTSAS
jgi:hypothetical protein